MTIPPSALSEYNLKWGPRTDVSLSPSSAEPMSREELLALADPEAKKLWDGLSLDYAPMVGLPVLRDTIAGLYEKVRASEVVTFAGAQEGIFSLMHRALKSGDHAVVVTPCYDALLAVPIAIGAEVTQVRLRFEEDWRLDVDRVAAAFRADTKLLVINFPHNPTGSTIDRPTLDRVLSIAADVGAVVLSDEVFRLLDPDAPPPAADLYERAVSLDVMSKAWGLGGVRVGWIATQDAGLRTAALGVKGWTSICNGASDEVLALVAVRARMKIIARNLGIIGENRALLDAFFARNADRFEWVRPRAGCLAFPRLVSGDVKEEAERLARDHRTLILPGRLFHSTDDYFRLGYGRRTLPKALAALESGSTEA